MHLRVAEWIAVGYFAYLAAAMVLPRTDFRYRRRVALILLAIGATFPLRSTSPVAASPVRDWVPLMDLLLAYWLPGMLAPAANGAWERRLLAMDDRWLRLDSTRACDHARRGVAAALEISYLFCYPMVPLGFAILYFGGFAAGADRFWTAVLLAVLPCYGLVIWLPMRPPRLVRASKQLQVPGVRALNLRVLQHASIQLNTFPSAHVSGSVATALAVADHVPVAGAGLATIAAAIAVGSVVRRYHYALDAVLGLALGVAGFVLSRRV